MYNCSDVKILDCSVFEDESLFDKYYLKMNDRRKEKIQKCKFLKDKWLSLGVGYLALSLLNDHDINDSVLFDKDGKPYLACGLYISLSHSERYAIAALSDKPIGVDIEQNKNDISDIARRFYTTEEKEYVHEFPEKEKERMYEIFSRKECMIKRDGFDDFRKLNTMQPKNNGTFISYPVKDYSCVIYCDSQSMVNINIIEIKNQQT